MLVGRVVGGGVGVVGIGFVVGLYWVVGVGVVGWCCLGIIVWFVFGGVDWMVGYWWFEDCWCIVVGLLWFFGYW